MSKDYFRVIDAINDCYKKMLEIGKCNKLFRPDHGGLPGILTAKSRIDFFMAKKNILLQYNQYVKTGAPRLTISIDVEIVPDLRIYANSNKPTSEMVLCPILWGINIHIFMPVRLDKISNSIVDTRLKFVYVYQKNLASFTPTFFDNVNFKR
jgi:hypothetical protein